MTSTANVDESQLQQGGDVERDDSHPVTGWYLEGIGMPPPPIPETEIQKNGARYLSLENIDDIFAEDEIEGDEGVPEPEVSQP
jgi:hypothetical protein